jgi:hypothetical protein
VTSGCRESGFVTQVPSLIRSVSRAVEARVTHGSRKSAGESQTPNLTYPRASARAISAPTPRGSPGVTLNPKPMRATTG